MSTVRRTLNSNQLACEMCHSVHHYDNSSSKGLRLANDQDQMCMDCHRSRNQQSHTSGTHPVNIKYSDAVTANPTKFKASPENANPANPTSDLSTRFTSTGNVVCSTCHGVHFSDSRSSTFDGASSAKGRYNYANLSSSDGYILRTDRRGVSTAGGQTDKLNICTNCHAGKTNHNAHGQDIQCSDCHGAHVEYDESNSAALNPLNMPNVYLIRRNVAKAGQPSKIYFRYTGTPREYNNANGTGVCQGCHDVPPPGGIYPPEHDSSSATVCNSCHSHGGQAGSFSIQMYDLSVTKSGNGSGNVTLDNGRTFTWNGVNGTAGYMGGALVTLTATPNNNDTFTGWSGACSGTGTCQVTMDAAKSAVATFIIDITPPNAPSVSGTAQTNSSKPTWNWTSGGGGNGNYRARLDNPDLSSGTFTPSGTSYTPLSALAEGPHTLYVQERDQANNWSISGSSATTIDTSPPTAPSVSGTALTNNTKPTWSWTSGGGGNGIYRARMDNPDLTSGTFTPSGSSYTPLSTLTEGPHTLYVQERDSANNWSPSGSFTTTIDITAPTVDAFSLPANVNGLTATNIAFSASDNAGITSWCLTETNNSSTCGWQGSQPTSFTFSGSTYGSRTLYAFVRDGANNTSAPVSNSATTNLIPISFTLSTPAVIAVAQAETSNRNITVTATGGYNSSTDMGATIVGGVPAGVTLGFSSQNLVPSPGGSTVTLTVSTTVATPPSNYTIRVTATGSGDTKTIDIPFTVVLPLSITTSTLTAAVKGTAYTTPINTLGGVGAVSCSLANGSALPTGLTLSGCCINGTPTSRVVSAPFTISTNDSTTHTASQALDLRVYDPAYRALQLSSSLGWSVIKNDVSGAITVRVIDDYGSDANVAFNTQITISSSSSTGRFSLDGISFSFGSTVNPSIPQGTNALTFLYRDTVAGNYTITASQISQSWTSDSHTISVTTVPDTTPPVITAFTMPATSISLTVAINLTATDASGIVEYCVMETDSTNGCSWSATPPPDHTFDSFGSKTLYAFARDGSGNISAANLSHSKTISLTPQKLTLFLSKSEAAAGSVTSNPAGITCLTDCNATFAQFSEFDQVALTATPAAGYYFLNWNNCSNVTNKQCTVTMQTGMAPVTANFSAKKITTLSLFPKLQTLRLNDPLTLNGQLSTIPAGQTTDLNGQKIAITISGPDGIMTREATTSDTSGTWAYPISAGDIFTKRGTYLISVKFTGAEKLMDSQSETVTVLVEKSAGYAIVIHGKLANNEGIDDHKLTTDNVIKQLKARSILDSNIKYLFSTTDSAPLKADVQAAIETWARDKMDGSPAPLYIVMVDHGSIGKFHLGGDTGDFIITPGDLNTWLTNLENGLTKPEAKLEKRFIVIGTCYSGSFISALSQKPSPGNAGRVVITSADPNEQSIRGPQIPSGQGLFKRSGEYFLDVFFTRIGRGDTIRDSFRYASDVIRNKDSRKVAIAIHDGVMDTLAQHPLIDDNGDKVGSYALDNNHDGSAVASLYIGDGAVKTNAADNPADIKTTTPAQFLQSTQIDTQLWLTAGTFSRIGNAWVEIRKPVSAVNSSSGQVILELEMVNLVPNANQSRWEVNTSSSVFNDQGTYEIFYYTQDSLTGEISPMAHSYVYKARTDAVDNASPTIFDLKSPANGSQQSSILALEWNSSSDSDGLTYTVSVASDVIFGSEVFHQEGITDSFTVIPSGALQNDKTYYWRVIATDAFGAQRVSTHSWSFTTSNNNALPGFVKGYVINKTDNSPIADASISTTDGSTTSLSTGVFLLPLPPNDYTLTISASGYQDESIPVSLSTGITTSSVVYLQHIQPVSGECGIAINSTYTAAPAQNLCKDNASPAVGGNGPWTWVCPGTNGGTGSLTCTAGITQFSLLLSMDGNGSGSVNCSRGIDSVGCNGSFNPGDGISLHATSDWKSLPVLWGGNCSGSTPPDCVLTMAGNRSVIATFNANYQAQIAAVPYSSLQTALNSAGNSATVEAMAYNFLEPILFDRSGIEVFFDGGRGPNYTLPTVGYTAVNGSFRIKQGTIRIKGPLAVR
jgi:hypothetical protein